MHKRNLLKIALALVAGVLGTASTAWSDSFTLTLIGSGGGTYDYGITVPAGSSITFNDNQTITLTGLSGVTGGGVTGVLADGFTLQSFTSSSVTFAQSVLSITGAPGPFTLDNTYTTTPSTFANLFVEATAPLGTVDWSGQASVGTFSGTVGGPVGVPEPGSLSMLLAGAASLGCLVLFARR